jgi:hypothetical protein
VSLVVQKYGGSSSPTPRASSVSPSASSRREGRQRRRRRRLRDGRHDRRTARPRPRGEPRSRRRARSTCCSPPASASRWRCSPWRSPTSASAPAPSPAARPASSPTPARQGQDHRRHARGASPRQIGKGRIVIVAGFQGVSRDTKEITTLGPRRLRHDRRRPGCRAAVPMCARSTPTSTASSLPTRASCPRPQDRSHHQRGDARARGQRLEGAAPAQRRVRPPLRHPHPCPLVLQPQGGHARHRPPHEGQSRGSSDHRRRRHDRSEAKVTVVGVPDRTGMAAAIFAAIADAEINIDMIVQNVSATRPA